MNGPMTDTPRPDPPRNRPLSHRDPRGDCWLHTDLGLMEYEEAWRLQTALVEAKRHGTAPGDVVLFVEHPPVFTLGRRGGLENLKVPEPFLASRGIRVVHIERGGDITYHGPGQLVVYPVVDLRRAGLGVKNFVTALEEVMIRAAADQGVEAERNSLNRVCGWPGTSWAASASRSATASPSTASPST